ncbi:hypothetical protein Tco_0494845 [Tanacetum coccineum]
MFKFLQTRINHADFRKFFWNLNFGGSTRILENSQNSETKRLVQQIIQFVEQIVFQNLKKFVTDKQSLFPRIVHLLRGVYVLVVTAAKQVCSCIVDKVNHTVETDMVKLMVEIECFSMSFDESDKETGSSDGLQRKQADLSCVHALNELHLHEIHVAPSKHEADLFSSENIK